MNELIEKLSSYNIFNYLLPGAVFAFLLKRVTAYSIRPDNLFTAFFAYYFTGLIISRIGSLVIEPILKRSGVVKFSDYRSFLSCLEKDAKLEILSEQNNTYRTLVSLIVVLGVTKIVELTSAYFSIGSGVLTFGTLAGLFLLFIFSYRKQTAYIRKRIERSTHQ